MGLLKQFGPEPDPYEDLVESGGLPEAQPMPVLAPDQEIKAVPVKKELEIKRDPHGTIESVTGVDREGRRVRFDFERDGRRQLERIKVR